MPFHVHDKVREPLYAVIPIFNPFRWKSRWKHTERAIKHFMDSGAVVYLVEASFNRRESAFADSGLDGLPANCGVLGTDNKFRHRYIHYTTKDELWLKENLINVGAGQLPHDWQQLCWLDADIHFVRPNWVGECIHKLQHYAVLQMFSQARDVGPNYELMPQGYAHSAGNSIMAAHHSGQLERLHPWKKDCYYHAGVFPGLAWAATRQAWDDLGGLLDFAIWGGGDWHMSHALIEQTEYMMREDLHRNYKKMVMQWYYRCHTHIRRNVGVMEGVVMHHWHGRKTERGYNAKHELLSKIGFDPLRHLKRDYQGLYQLHDDRSTAFVQLRDMMRKVAAERNEDSNDTRADLIENIDSGKH